MARGSPGEEAHEPRTESSGGRRDRRADQGSRRGLRRRLPRHLRAPGGRAAHAAARRRRDASASSRTRSPSGRPTRSGADALKALLEGPTALTFVRGDAALAAKALSDFRRETELLDFKGGLHGRRDARRPSRSWRSRACPPATSSTASSSAWWPRRITGLVRSAERAASPASPSRWARSPAEEGVRRDAGGRGAAGRGAGRRGRGAAEAAAAEAADRGGGAAAEAEADAEPPRTRREPSHADNENEADAAADADARRTTETQED